MPVASGILSLPVGPTSGGKVYAYNNLSTTPQTVVNPNAGRVAITFHNPGAVDAFVAPQVVRSDLVNKSDTPLVPSTIALGGCVRIFANGGTWVVTGECQGGWQAFSASGIGNPLTVIDSNI